MVRLSGTVSQRDSDLGDRPPNNHPTVFITTCTGSCVSRRSEPISCSGVIVGCDQRSHRGLTRNASPLVSEEDGDRALVFSTFWEALDQHSNNSTRHNHLKHVQDNGCSLYSIDARACSVIGRGCFPVPNIHDKPSEAQRLDKQTST